jgi:uncharacterized protein (DUF1800 family)
MNKSNLWSLRLGFSSKQARLIEQQGIEKFLERSFASSFEKTLPAFLKDEPKTIAELRQTRLSIKNNDSEEQKKILKKQIKKGAELRDWWIEKMKTDEFPLREKMVCFWHNHFVSTIQKVKANYWIYQHNQALREHAFGNFKTLTKIMIKSNAMVRYLDNNDNKKGQLNENLSRELLELFTLGIGHYTEDDIKNGAKALAGLTFGEEYAQYRPFLEVNETITYLGKTGTFKADDLVDIIFEQTAIPYLITKKILQWFVYDNPSEQLVKQYGDYFKKQNFEIKPLLKEIVIQEFVKNKQGTKIKDPLVYIMQLTDELQIRELPNQVIAFFCKQQGMDLFNQPNVKGWTGGNSWLSSQLYLQRNNVADLFCSGRNLSRKTLNAIEEGNITFEKIDIKLDWKKNQTNKEIIAQLANRLLFAVDEEVQKDMEKVLKYDFDSNSPNADAAVLRLFNFITKSPEFQII